MAWELSDPAWHFVSLEPWIESLQLCHTLLGIVDSGLAIGADPCFPSSVNSVLFLMNPWGTAILVTYLLSPSVILDFSGAFREKGAGTRT